MVDKLRVHFDEESSEEVSLTNDFHCLGRIIPTDQKLVTIAHDRTVADAFKLMKRVGYSQLPVVAGNRVLGIFSYRSFSTKITEIGEALRKEQCLPGDWEVAEFIEKPVYARLENGIDEWFDELDKNDCLLIGNPDLTQGILTSIDILRYLYRVASPFVLIAEIELCLRALIRTTAKPSDLKDMCDQCLNHYPEEHRPTAVEQMTFADYASLVSRKAHWNQYFKSVLGGSRLGTKANLDEIAQLRNDIFHFRRKLSTIEYDNLVGHRDWILLKATTAEQIKKGGGE
ncbi:CBS domain-containing protein [bacterium]|nr:CBS domain-containing protein [bacterium]MDB4458536.1 CBS domain-containing protein [bacterium]